MQARQKMSREDRAKQFMPFAALRGYEEALRRKEKTVAAKTEVSEEYAELLDRKLRQIRKNDIITVIFFHRNEYLKLTGMVAGIDEASRILQVVNVRIPFEDILEVSGEHIPGDAND